MPGPCPQGVPTQDAHELARCQDRGNCTGPGCRLRRAKRHDPIMDDLRAARAELAAELAAEAE